MILMAVRYQYVADALSLQAVNQGTYMFGIIRPRINNCDFTSTHDIGSGAVVGEYACIARG